MCDVRCAFGDLCDLHQNASIDPNTNFSHNQLLSIVHFWVQYGPTGGTGY